MKKQNILLIGMLTVATMVSAQQEFDALKYSMKDISGTARFVAMSGAFGALGGDMSALAENPAGIGVYRSSEVSISVSGTNSMVQSDFTSYLNGDFTTTGTSASTFNAGIQHFGYVGSFRTYDESAISNFNFGVTYNRRMDYNRILSARALGHPASLLDRICRVENQLRDDNPTNPIYHTNFFNMVNATHLVGLNSTTDNYESILNDLESVDNSTYQSETGGTNEWNFTLGANYGHIFYVGLGLGVQRLKYNMTSEYSELFEAGGSMQLNNVLTTEGTGMNFKIGAIVRPVPNLRLGFSIQTPTYYNLTDVWGASMASVGMINETTGTAYFPDPVYDDGTGYYDYKMDTPGEMLFSAAYQFESKGFLSIDWEIIDYSDIFLKTSTNMDMGSVNSDYIASDFRSVNNFRVGGEYRLSENFSLRAGFALYGSPIKPSVEADNLEIITSGTVPQYGIEQSTTFLSGGVGYRSGAFFLDAALQYQMRNEHFFPFFDSNVYFDATSRYADVADNKMKLVLSTGFKF